MKTTNSARKTENRTIGNSTLIALALVVSFVFINMNVNAKGLETKTKQNSSLSQLILLNGFQANQAMRSLLLIPDAYASELSFRSDAYYFETSAEKNLEIESWMTNQNNFAAPVISMEMEAEPALSVEDWMLENQNFLKTSLTTQTEQALEVEDWMLDASIYGQ